MEELVGNIALEKISKSTIKKQTNKKTLKYVLGEENHKILQGRKAGKPIYLLGTHKPPQTLLTDNNEHFFKDSLPEE